MIDLSKINVDVDLPLPHPSPWTMTRIITPSSSPEVSNAQSENEDESEEKAPRRLPLKFMPTDPFKYNLKSWEDWEREFSVKPLPPSFALKEPPTVDFFCIQICFITNNS
jgi:hypothetical protein